MSVGEGSPFTGPLPPDLAGFLAAGRPVEYHRRGDGDLAIAPRPAGELVAEAIPVRVSDWEPLGRDPYEIETDSDPAEAVPVAAVCADDFGSVRFILWLPGLGRYALRDGPDGPVRVFAPDVAWTRLAANPARLLHPGPVGVLCVRPSPPAGPMPRPRLDRGWVALVRAVRRLRRRDWLALNLVQVVLIALYLLNRTSPPPAISPETYERITIGMTERDVGRIVRARTGWYGSAFVEYAWEDRTDKRFEEWGEPRRFDVWADRYGELRVGYDGQGRVCSKRLHHDRYRLPDHPEDWSWWKRLRHRAWPSDHPPAYIMFTF